MTRVLERSTALSSRKISTQTPATPVRKHKRMRTITIKGGTPQHGDSLCRTCYWAHIQRGFRESEELLHCCFSRFRLIPFPVAECTDYCDKTVPSRQDMERIALTIDPSRARRAAGFAGIGFFHEEEEAEAPPPDGAASEDTAKQNEECEPAFAEQVNRKAI